MVKIVQKMPNYCTKSQLNGFFLKCTLYLVPSGIWRGKNSNEILILFLPKLHLPSDFRDHYECSFLYGSSRKDEPGFRSKGSFSYQSPPSVSYWVDFVVNEQTHFFREINFTNTQNHNVCIILQTVFEILVIWN